MITKKRPASKHLSEKACDNTGGGTKLRIYKHLGKGRDYVLFHGDCMRLVKKVPSGSIDLTLTSPPYCMGKEYEKAHKIEDFIKLHRDMLPEVIRITKDGGSICWQVGYHVRNGSVMPLDFLVHDLVREEPDMKLRNRIVWTYGHGLHSSKRFSGRHEVVLWYTKGDNYYFDLDAVRITQKYPGKRHYKGPRRGNYSGNPLGKNPSDVWDIPNVKARHVEKTEHPCQFPAALAQRFIRALTPRSATVFDPYIGSGTTGIVAIIEGRKFIGAEIQRKYYEIAWDRCSRALRNQTKYRPIDKPIFVPVPSQSVARKPEHFI